MAPDTGKKIERDNSIVPRSITRCLVAMVVGGSMAKDRRATGREDGRSSSDGGQRRQVSDVNQTQTERESRSSRAPKSSDAEGQAQRSKRRSSGWLDLTGKDDDETRKFLKLFSKLERPVVATSERQEGFIAFVNGRIVKVR